MRNGAEHDSAGRGAEAVDDNGFARGAQALIFIDIGSDPAAAVIGDADHGVACTDACDQKACHQQNRRQQARHEFHAQPQNLSIPNLSVPVMRDLISVLSKRLFVQRHVMTASRFKSSVARGMQ
ncbi:hypothetical protein [Tardiphaga alba]|uniref:hypothetical protein n=1 Tax=Tardiphaga alba TaxID=340268 RepID=UPI002010DD46|nr:hypothetical protein [Tardiphaga alba]